MRRGAAGVSGGGDDGRLGVTEEPLDGLAVGAVAELARELEDPRGAHRRHSHAPPSAVDFGVPVAGGRQWRSLPDRDGELRIL